jgi:pyruvate-formate lyase
MPPWAPAQDGVAVEVVVMVMRQDDRTQRRQRVDAERRRMEAFRAGPWHRRRAFRKHGVGQPPAAVQLHQQGRMAEAEQGRIRRRRQRGRVQGLHRNRPVGHRRRRLAGQHAPEQAERLA